jgi:hypothetical protein
MAPDQQRREISAAVLAQGGALDRRQRRDAEDRYEEISRTSTRAL